MSFDKRFAVGYLLGYFVLAFVLVFGINLYPNWNFIVAKLIWADMGLLFVIVFGIINDYLEGGKKYDKRNNK